MRRLTKKEWHAIAYALGAATAGVLDGIDEDTPEYNEMMASLMSAHEKVTERL